MSLKTLVLAGDGLNCEHETAFAIELAGGKADICHVNSLFENPKKLLDYAVLAIPGGFSFGDEVSSGKLLAVKLRLILGDTLQEFIDRDRLVIGICNGFQMLVKLGLLPVSKQGQQQMTLTHNRQHQFINQWVTMTTEGNSPFFSDFKANEKIALPIRHGEGRLVLPIGSDGSELLPHIALQYTRDVNGSFNTIAGLSNTKGNVLGLMPHPEGFVRWTQHPTWTSLSASEKEETPVGLRIFKNMIEAAK